MLEAPTMEIFLVEILSVATGTFSFFTPPEARSDLQPSLTHLQYMPFIQFCHLFSLVEIFSVLNQATGTFSFLAPPIYSICHLFSLSTYYLFLVTPIALAIYALCLP